MRERESNIELLRIVATIMIILLHYSSWFLSFSGITCYWEGGTPMAITRAMLNSITCIGVDVFVLISGYFSIRPKGKSLINLFTCLAFFYVGTYLLNCCVTDGADFHVRSLLRKMMAFSCENWFIQCYLFLMLFSPVLNAFVEKVTEKTLLLYTGIFTACAFYFGCIHDSTYFYFNQGYSVTTFILIYLIGRYIKLYGQERFKNVSYWAITMVWIVCIIALCLCKLFASKYASLYSYCSPLRLIPSAALLLLFTRIQIKSKFINWVARSCLAAYILHTSMPVMGWIISVDYYAVTNCPPPVWLAIGLAISVVTILASVLFDNIRLLICRPLLNGYEKIKNCINYEK